MNDTPRSVHRFVALSVAMLLLAAACASDAGPGWTFAPLGPTGSPGGSPAASPGGSTTFDVVTRADQPLAFVPAELQMPPATSVTVNYLNDSNLEHNINFFAGADASAPSLGATARVTGPGASESVTFTTPGQPGDYFFWCDVHGQAMVGSYTVTQ